MNILPNMSARIWARPQAYGVRPDRIVLAQAEDWWIEDILVGGVSQLGHGSRGVPGAMFSSQALDSLLMISSVDAQSDFVIQARYMGPSPEGAPFVCGVLCDAILDDSCVCDAVRYEVVVPVLPLHHDQLAA